MKLTYGELGEAIQRMSPEQLNQNVTIESPDGEFFQAKLETASEQNDAAGILDNGHPFLSVDNTEA